MSISMEEFRAIVAQKLGKLDWADPNITKGAKELWEQYCMPNKALLLARFNRSELHTQYGLDLVKDDERDI